MKKLVLAVCMLVGLLVAARGSGGEKKATNEAEGVWKVVGMERNGAKVAADVIEKLDMKLIVKGEDFTVMVGDKVSDKGTTKIDRSKTPNTVDSKGTEGANQGKTVLGIRQVDGDSMKACYDLQGKTRPTEFATTDGSGFVLILYRRVR